MVQTVQKPDVVMSVAETLVGGMVSWARAIIPLIAGLSYYNTGLSADTVMFLAAIPAPWVLRRIMQF